jgi:hypothetical protein
VTTKTLFMETTKIDANKTAGEVAECLAMAGATRVMNDYKSGVVTALTFAIRVGDVEIPFRLPINPTPIFGIIQKRRPASTRNKKAPADLEQSIRVAWRQILRWVQAQLALIETGMVKTQEVFLPYVCNLNGETFYQQIEANQFKQLPQFTGRDGA